jgi:hypothetical protein
MIEKDLTVKLRDAREVGDNILAVEVDGMLVLIIDPATTIGESASGKMMGIASTGGFVQIPGGLKMNLYAGKKIVEGERNE